MKRNYYRKKRNWKAIFGIVGVIAFVGVISLGCLIGYAYLCQIPQLRIARVMVVGNKQISKEEVLNLANIGHKSLISLNTQKIRQRLLHHPLIKAVNISRIWPQTVKIKIEERKIIALAYIKDHWWWVDKGGRCILGKANKFDLPVITGISSVSDPKIKPAISFLKILSQNKFPLTLSAISEIHVDKDLGITVFTIKGRKIVFGKGNFIAKLNILKKVLSYIQKKGITLSQIDLTDTNRVYAKLGN